MKHTTAAFAAVVMIGSLAVSQMEDLKRSYNTSSLLSAAASDSIVYEETFSGEYPAEPVKAIAVASEEEIQAELSEQYTQEELDRIYEEKSQTDEAYVILTADVLTVREFPSKESAKIDSLEKNTTVKILESTDEWYKVGYGDNKSGYVSKSNITQDKQAAETAAKYFDNFRYGKVKTNGGTIRVRKGPSTSSEILGELDNGSLVLLLTNSNDFVKVCYSEDYLDGYIIASAIELTDT
jgi:uncharacterized protein YgiM (DUF1202 family)